MNIILVQALLLIGGGAIIAMVGLCTVGALFRIARYLIDLIKSI